MGKYRELKDRLERIEFKCDRILSLQTTYRQSTEREMEIDMLIDRMHRNAKMMRVQCCGDVGYNSKRRRWKYPHS